MKNRNGAQGNNSISRPLLLSLALAALVAISARAEYFTIEKFHSDIIVQENSSIEITETIEVNFHSSRHGIFRKIPFRYNTEIGKTLVMPVKIQSVTNKKGRPWQYRVSKDGNLVNVRIGDPDRFVREAQVYVIKYQVENALLFLDEHDELYWNVTGNNWETEIKVASARVKLKSQKTAGSIKCACYTGRYGSTESECTYEVFADSAKFAARGSLVSWQGFTIVMGWNKGIVTPPTDWQRTVWDYNLTENWVFLLPVVVFIFMVFHWFRRGRDPRIPEPMIVLYEPPRAGGKLISATLVGTLVDERLDARDLTAGIVNLAARGYLEIREVNPSNIEFGTAVNDHNLTKLKNANDGLSEFDRALFEKLFPGSKEICNVSDLKNNFYKIVPLLRNLVYDELLKFGFYAVKPEKVKLRYVLAGMATALLGMFAVFFFLPGNLAKGMFASVLGGIAVMIFSPIMPARTRTGALVKKQINGFREFMDRADRDKIERLGPRTYYEYLPYAIALGVVDSWTKAFEGLLDEPPGWYVVSGRSAGFNAGYFSKSISSVTSSMGAAMFAAPRGSGLSSSGGSGFSGGGGGGFSGGGGGGGGGGSW